MRTALRRTTLVSVGVGLAILGDSTLYAVLPTQVETLGLSAAAVGLALSINRIVRLVGNPAAAQVTKRLGWKGPFVTAIVLGAVTTLAWALRLPVALLLAARALWGLCWSVLRLGGYMTALSAPPEQRGTAFGLFRSIFRIGSLLAAVTAGLLTDRWGFHATLAIMGGITALGLPIYLCWDPLRGMDSAPTPVAKHNGDSLVSQPQPVSSRGWLSSLIGDRDDLAVNVGGMLHYLLLALLATTMGYHVQQSYSHSQALTVIGAATLSGLLNAWLWASNTLLAPLCGMMADRLGRQRALLLVTGLQVAGLLVVGVAPGLGGAVAAIMVALSASSGMEVLLDTLAGDGAAGNSHSSRSLANYANWTDAGGALGPLIGYSLGVSWGLPALYAVGALLSLAWVMLAWRAVGRAESTSLVTNA